MRITNPKLINCWYQLKPLTPLESEYYTYVKIDGIYITQSFLPQIQIQYTCLSSYGNGNKFNFSKMNIEKDITKESLIKDQFYHYPSKYNWKNYFKNFWLMITRKARYAQHHEIELLNLIMLGFSTNLIRIKPDTNRWLFLEYVLNNSQIALRETASTK